VRIAGYTRVSTNEQVESGAGLAAQSDAIEREAQRRGWSGLRLFTDAGISAKSMDGRDALADALVFVEGQRGSVLVVAKLDRLTRSLRDFAELLERSRRRGWALVALDLGVDTSTPSGEMLASVVASVAQYERRLIGVRTRDAMQAKIQQGATFGRKRAVPESVRRSIVRLRREGQSHEAIARTLNERGTPTSYGGQRWYRSTVSVVLRYSNAN
jgi:DNA invertase Pin-like site-specific DNA recombinase